MFENATDGTNNKYLRLNRTYLKADPQAYFSHKFSISAWVKVMSVKRWSRIIDFGNGPFADNVIFGLADSNGNSFIHIYQSFLVKQVQGALKPLILNTWTHITGISNGSHVIIYKNGTLDVIYESYNADNSIKTFNYIGKSNWLEDELADAYFRMIRIYNRTLAPSEIIELMSNF